MSVPAKRIAPCTGRWAPAMARASELLPAPLGPTRATSSQAATRSDTSCTTMVAPCRTVTCSSSSMARHRKEECPDTTDRRFVQKAARAPDQQQGDQAAEHDHAPAMEQATRFQDADVQEHADQGSECGAEAAD